MGELRSFSKSELILDQDGAKCVLVFFFGNNGVSPGSLTDEVIGFAQGMLIEGLEWSEVMAYVEEGFRSFYGANPQTFSDLGSIIKDFVTKSAEIWWKNSKVKSLKNPKIYESIRVVLARNFRSEYEDILFGEN
jgi:hypothetical protein